MYERPAEHWLEPAATVIQKMGGAHKVAEILNISPSAVYRWMWPRKPAKGESRGTGGLIPSDRQQQIMEWSRSNGYPVNLEDFFLRSKEDTRAA